MPRQRALGDSFVCLIVSILCAWDSFTIVSTALSAYLLVSTSKITNSIPPYLFSIFNQLPLLPTCAVPRPKDSTMLFFFIFICMLHNLYSSPPCELPFPPLRCALKLEAYFFQTSILVLIFTPFSFFKRHSFGFGPVNYITITHLVNSRWVLLSSFALLPELGASIILMLLLRSRVES